MTVLPDTSVWVSYLRTGAQGPAAALDGLLAAQEVVICGPVVAEILAGARAPRRAELGALLSSLPWAELGHAQWHRVGDLAAQLRERGETVPLTDLEIAVAAESCGARLWSWDGDFDRVAGAMSQLLRYAP